MKMNQQMKTLLPLAAFAGLVVSANAALVIRTGTLVASFIFGDRDSMNSTGDYTVNTTAGAGVLHADGLYMTGQSGDWVENLAGSGSTGPISAGDNQSGRVITFAYATGGETVNHNNQASNTGPRNSFWRMGAPWSETAIPFTLSGLNDSSTYDLIFYSGGELQGTTGRNALTTIGGSPPTPDLDGDANFFGVSPTGGVISGIWPPIGSNSYCRVRAELRCCNL